MHTSPATLWWEQITGPSAFIRSVRSALDEGKTAVLSLPSYTPWLDTMRESIARDLIGKTISRVDCSGSRFFSPEDVSAYLFSHFANHQQRYAFLPHLDNHLDFIIKNRLLANFLIWPIGIHPDDNNAWIAFSQKFHRKGKESGQFVLESASAKVPSMPGQSIRCFAYDLYVFEYDTLLFSALLSMEETLMPGRSGRSTPGIWEQYLAFLASSLCGTDAETASNLLQQADLSVKDPLAAMASVMLADCHASARGENNKDHPYSMLRADDKDALHQCVWRAQLKSAFPAIEQNRIRFVEKWYRQIEACLPHTDQFGNLVFDPVDVELGMLVHLCSQISETGLRKLYIDDRDDYENMLFLHGMRNRLAHMQLCSPKEMRRLLCAPAV